LKNAIRSDIVDNVKDGKLELRTPETLFQFREGTPMTRKYFKIAKSEDNFVVIWKTFINRCEAFFVPFFSEDQKREASELQAKINQVKQLLSKLFVKDAEHTAIAVGNKKKREELQRLIGDARPSKTNERIISLRAELGESNHKEKSLREDAARIKHAIDTLCGKHNAAAVYDDNIIESMIYGHACDMLFGRFLYANGTRELSPQYVHFNDDFGRAKTYAVKQSGGSWVGIITRTKKPTTIPVDDQYDGDEYDDGEYDDGESGTEQHGDESGTEQHAIGENSVSSARMRSLSSEDEDEDEYPDSEVSDD